MAIHINILHFKVLLGLKIRIDLKNKRQLLDIGLYLSLKLQDYKHFKYKVIIGILRYIILLSHIYKMSI